MSELLKSADLNGEFNNILNNPISLISPTTGAINFNLQAHTNLLPGVVSASSGTAGQALVVSGGASVWGTPAASPTAFTTMSSGQTLIGTSSGAVKSLNIGTTGQVLAVTSSNTDPAWQVVPPDGGLSTGSPSTGALYYISTAGKFVPLVIGTSGQILQVSTALLPIWGASAAAGGGTLDPETTIQFYEDFFGLQYTSASGLVQANEVWMAGANAAVTGSTATGSQGRLLFANDIPAGAVGLTLGNNTTPTQRPFATINKPTIKVRFGMQASSATHSLMAAGLTDTVLTAIPNNGILFVSTGAGSTVYAIVSNTAVQSTLSMGVTSTSLHNYQAVVTASSNVNFLVDGVAVGSINSSNVPNVGLQMGIGMNPGTTVNTMAVDYLYVTSTR